MDNLNDELLYQMMREKDNRNKEGDGENNLNSSNEDNVCSDDVVPDVLKRISELSDGDIRSLEFDSEQDAYEFYSEYVKFKGFVVRKDDVYRDRDKRIKMRQLVCNRQGEMSEKHLNRTNRIKETKTITRTNCLARIRLYLDNKNNKWRVGMFESEHNHELTPANMAQVNSLHLYGVRTCHIMGLIMGQKGGHSDLGFCKKDFYNHIGKENRAKIEDVDAFAALCYLQAKNEIEKVAALNVVDRTEVGNIVTMKMNKFGSPNALYVVIYDKSLEEGDTSKKEVLRYGAVGATCNRLNKVAHKNPHNFMKNIEAIHRLADQTERQDGTDVNIADMSRVVRDPTIVKTKGAPHNSKKLMKKRKCSYCKRLGDIVRTCSKFSTQDQLQTVEEEESSVESDGDSRDVTFTYNNETLNHSKGVIPSVHGKSSSRQVSAL
ncbi:FAR1 DNA-binding domain [Sesbania bispinosa]|nr:FAR1 DNA-binding domain [Sesbania bispinosa]